MNTPGRWLVRAGALLVLLGFFLPVMTVSCGGYGGVSRSLLQLTSESAGVLLFGVLIGMLVALTFTFFIGKSSGQTLQFLIAQAGGTIFSVLCLLVALLSIYNTYSQYGVFDITPQFGAFFLIIGYILCLAGLVLQWMEKPSYAPTAASGGYYQPEYYPQANAGYGEQMPQYPQGGYANVPAVDGPRLELVRGALAMPVVILTKDDFSLGRGTANDVQVPDPKISRQHIRLRYAQGYWYLQDQQSKSGTFVNGQPVQAVRLNSGDEIRIGDTSFIFRA